MLIERETRGTFTAGPLDILCILKLPAGTFHAAFFEEYPMPGPVESVESTPVVRLKSKMHHTTGAATLEEAQTVYGHEEKGLKDYVYSDRMWQWDYRKAQASFDLANQAAEAGKVTRKSAKWLEIAFSHYYDKPVEVRHVLAGVNLSNGYPYFVVGYKIKPGPGSPPSMK